jgi:tetratricopeptide (TPR) repeat protein
MTKLVHCIATLVFLATSLSLMGNYPTERAGGMELVDAGKHEAAAEYFLRLTESYPKPFQQSDALTIAALATAKAGRPKEAFELAARIPEPEMAELCKIKLLEETRQWQALVDSASGIDFKTWPDSLIFPALMARARARTALGQHDQAEADLRLALEATVSNLNQARVWYALAQNAQAANAGSDQVLAAYNELIRLTTSGGGMLQRGLSERALLLSGMGRHKEALADLAELEQRTNNDPHWVCTVLIAYGDVYRSMGETAKAKSSFEKAAAVANAPAAQIETARKRLAE